MASDLTNENFEYTHILLFHPRVWFACVILTLSLQLHFHLHINIVLILLGEYHKLRLPNVMLNLRRQGCLVSSTSQWDDVARPRRGSLMQSLWEACDKEAMSTVRHPLVVQLGLGTLPEVSGGCAVTRVCTYCTRLLSDLPISSSTLPFSLPEAFLIHVHLLACRPRCWLLSRYWVRYAAPLAWCSLIRCPPPPPPSSRSPRPFHYPHRVRRPQRVWRTYWKAAGAPLTPC